MATGQSTPFAFVPQPPPAPRDPAGYLADVPAESVVVRITHDGEPVSKHRVRFNSRTKKTYTPNKTKAHERVLADLAAMQLSGAAPASDWEFGIRAVFYTGTHQRKDVDNMLKAVLDAMNGLAFLDDTLVRELMGWKVLDTLRPRTEFVVYRIRPHDSASGVCVVCRKPFRSYLSWRGRRHCSRKCADLGRTTSAKVNCAHCGKELVREASVVKANVRGDFYCGAGCRGKHNRRITTCATCGEEINRPNSWSKPGQTLFYCSLECRPVPMRDMTTEARQAANRKGWETRRRKKEQAGGS